MGRRDRERRQAIQEGRSTPFRNLVQTRGYLRCGKCHAVVPDILADEHLKECQPLGARCAKCNQMIPPTGFINHFRACKGKQDEHTVSERLRLRA